MFGFSMAAFAIYPHHSDYLMITHACGWSTETEGGLDVKELCAMIQTHCDNCGKDKK